MKKNISLAKLVVCSCLFAASVPLAFAQGTADKLGSGTDLTDPASWTTASGTPALPPGLNDTAEWIGSSLGAGLTLPAAITWSNINVSGALSDIDIEGLGPLTNNDITLDGVNMTLGITNWIGVFSGNPNTYWTVAPGKTLTATGRVRGTNTLVFTGGGTVVIAPPINAGWTGGTIVSNNTTVIFVNNTSGGGNFSLTNGAILVISNTAAAITAATADLPVTGGTIKGSGTLLVTAPAGTPAQGAARFRINGDTVGLNPGSLIDVEFGALRNDNGNQSWRTNYASAFINTNGMLDSWDGYMQVDSLNGYGVVSKGWSTTGTFAMGAANGSGIFYGAISNNLPAQAQYGGAAGGVHHVWKLGTGTQTLMGTNTYYGNTVVSNGSFVIGGAGVLGNGTNYIGAINVVNPTSIFNYNSSQNQLISGAVNVVGQYKVSGSGWVTNTGAISGAGQVVVSGAGTLTLQGAVTYSGNTTISGAGSLILQGATANTLAGNVTGGGTGTLQLLGSGVTTITGNLNAPAVVGGGATLALNSTQAGTGSVTFNNNSALTMNALGQTQWSPPSLSMGTGCRLNFNGVTNSGTTTAPIKPGATVTVGGNVVVNVDSTADHGIVVGSSYPLLANAGALGNYTLGGQPVGWIGHLAVSGTTLVYVTDLQYDFWSNASGNQIWDIGTSANWAGNAAHFNAPLFTYKNGDKVIFDDSVGTNQNITISGVVSPSTVYAANNTNLYVLNSSAGNNIAGATGLTNNGTGTFTLLGGANTYSGGTTINAGTLGAGVLANNDAPSDIGQPNSTDPGFLVINGGTLAYKGASVAIDRGVTVGPNNGTISVTNPATTLTLNGLITGPGTFITGGSGTIVLTNGANSQARGTTVGAGSTVVLGSDGLAVLGTFPSNTINGTLDVAGNSIPFTNMNVAATGIPTTFIMGNNSIITNSGNTPVVFSNIFLQASSQAMTLAGTADEVVNGINGPGFPNHTVTNAVTGTVLYTGTNGSTGLTWAQMAPGTALIDRAGGVSAMNVFGGLVKMTGPTLNNAFFSGNALVVETGTFDLNGSSQVVGGLTSVAANTNGLVINNNPTNTLAALNLANAGGTFYGTVKDGTSKLAVNVTGTGTQFLAGTNAFTGGITNSSTGSLYYGGNGLSAPGVANSTIFNYPVTFVSAGSKINFNLTGKYTFNDTTVTGIGTFGEDNSNMVMTISQPLVNFTGTNRVLLGTLDLNPTAGSSPMLGGITVDSTPAARLVLEDQFNQYPEIAGNLTLGALSTVIFNFDGSGNSYFLVDGAITPNSAVLTVNVTNTTPLAVGHDYTLMSYGSINGAFSQIPVVTGVGLAPSAYAFIVAASGYVSMHVIQAYQWTHIGGGNWSVAGNWSLQPIIAGEIAFFGNSAANTYTTVTLDQSYTVGGLFFINTNSFGVVPSGGSVLTLNNNGSGVGINVTGGKSNLFSAPLVLNDSSGNASATVNSGTLVTLAGTVSGPDSLTMTGQGTLGLSGANTFAGPLTINSGTVKLGNGAAMGAFPTNYVNAGGTLDFGGQTIPLNATATASNVIVMATGGFLANSSPNQAVVHAFIQGSVAAGGTAWTFTGTGPIAVDWVWGPGFPNWYMTNLNSGGVTFGGTNDITGGIPVVRAPGVLYLGVQDTRSAPAELHAASSLVVLGGLVKFTGTGGAQMWTGGSMTLAGGTVDLNGNGQYCGGTLTSGGASGSGGAVLTNSNPASVSIITNTGGTFFGTKGGNVGFVYTATATMGGTNLFWGGLTVNGGTLTISNVLAATNTVTVNSGGVLNLLYSGTSTVTALVLGGASQGAGVYNNANTPTYITGSGSLTVVPPPTGPTSPVVITNNIIGGNLVITWPAGQGWRLVSQTNSLATGLQANIVNWTTVTVGTDGQYTIPLNKNNPTVFYKLVYP